MKWFVLACILVGCTSTRKGTETGNPSLTDGPKLDVRTTLLARTSDPEAVSLIEPGGDIVVDAAWLNLEDVEVRRATDCEGDEDDESTGLLSTAYTFNLLDGSAAFKLPLNETAYCEFNLDFLAADGATGTQPAELLDAAAVVIAHRTDETPVMLVFEESAQMAFKSEDTPLELSNDQSALLVAVDLSRWFENLDVANLDPASDGWIYIDAADDDAIAQQLEENFESAARLHVDANGDGQLDASEENQDVMTNGD